MMPITGPRNTEYPQSQVLMNDDVEDTSFQGWMMAPKEAVSNAPAWKVMFLGLILMKAFAGATMFAATFVVSVAAVRPKSERQIGNVPSIFPSSCTGSVIGAP
mmetsp:Transcript_23631/g.65063  ORF Transcript_23631/g.65063 Transcript_23631/m.65063 type:complete len:103 (-) Transcript_23631:1153-1461(-)